MRTVECPVWCVAITSLYEWFCLSDVVLMAVDLWRASHGQGAGGIRVEMANGHAGGGYVHVMDVACECGQGGLSHPSRDDQSRRREARKSL